MNKPVYLPVMLDVSNKKILIIGGGKAAAEKLRSLGQLGVNVDVISPDFLPEFMDKQWLNLIRRKYASGDLKNYGVVYCGINDPVVEKQIKREGLEAGALVNFIDNVQHSDFIAPSVIQNEYFSIFISTYGKGPGIAKKIRKDIEEKVDLESLKAEAARYIQARNNPPGR